MSPRRTLPVLPVLCVPGRGGNEQTCNIQHGRNARTPRATNTARPVFCDSTLRWRCAVAHTPPKSSARIPFFTSSSWKIDGASARTCEHASSRRGRKDARTHARRHARTSRSCMSGDAASALNSSTRAAPIAAVSSVSSNVVWNSEPFAAERDSAEKRCLSHCAKPRHGVRPPQPSQPAATEPCNRLKRIGGGGGSECCAVCTTSFIQY